MGDYDDEDRIEFVKGLAKVFGKSLGRLALLATCIVGLGFGYYKIISPIVKYEKKESALLNRAIAKADTNKDNVLQNEELGGLLKAIGSNIRLKDNAPYNVRLGNKTVVGDRIYKNNPDLYIKRSDLEKYVNQ